MTTATATKATAAKSKMIARIKEQTTEMLCNVFVDSTAKMDADEWAATAIVRGYVMDELEARNPEAFAAWMDCEDVELMEYPANFYLA